MRELKIKLEDRPEQTASIFVGTKPDAAAEPLSNISGSFLREGLASYLGEPPGALKIHYLQSGQPICQTKPNISFSLSHSEELLALAASRDVNLGLDVQKHRPYSERIWERIGTDQELQVNKTSAPMDFFKLWTIKEAALKCLGTGFAYPMQGLEVDFVNKEVKVLEISSKFHFVLPLQSTSPANLTMKYRMLDLFPSSTSALVWIPQKVPGS